MSIKPFLESDFVNNPSKIKGVIGLCNSGKTRWLKELLYQTSLKPRWVSCPRFTDLEFEIARLTDKIEMLVIDNFGDSFDHIQIYNAFKILKSISNNTQIYLEIHNTTALSQDLLPHTDYYLCTTPDEIPRPLQDCTSAELRHAHNLERIFRAGGFH